MIFYSTQSSSRPKETSLTEIVLVWRRFVLVGIISWPMISTCNRHKKVSFHYNMFQTNWPDLRPPRKTCLIKSLTFDPHWCKLRTLQSWLDAGCCSTLCNTALVGLISLVFTNYLPGPLDILKFYIYSPMLFHCINQDEIFVSF